MPLAPSEIQRILEDLSRCTPNNFRSLAETLDRRAILVDIPVQAPVEEQQQVFVRTVLSVPLIVSGYKAEEVPTDLNTRILRSLDEAAQLFTERSPDVAKSYFAKRRRP